MSEDLKRLYHIRDSIEIIEDHVASGMDDRKTLDAIEHRIAVIGEAANALSECFTGRYSEVPWRDIVGMRNMIIHEYFGVNEAMVKEVVARDIPALKEEVARMIEAERK